MKSLNTYFGEYSTYHQTVGNKVCHYIGIPMIMVTLLGLLSAWVIMTPGTSEFVRLDGGTLLVLGATAWYLVLDWRLGAPFFFVALGAYYLGRAIPTPWQWAGFVLGWIFQGIGHYKYEKKSPAFLKNLEHLLIGPLWIFARLFRH
jgi:uncharacterized membrane protein YGL010W